MKSYLSFEEFCAFCIDRISKGLGEDGVAMTSIDGDQDILASGVLDSHAFIDLLLEIEERTGVFIDVTERAVEEFSSFRGMYSIVTERNV